LETGFSGREVSRQSTMIDGATHSTTIQSEKDPEMNRMMNTLTSTMVCALALLTGCNTTQQSTPPVGNSGVTAIDILLEPDATMLKHAEANNARLLKVDPTGFSLDETHAPHITMLQCFARTEDLPTLYAPLAR